MFRKIVISVISCLILIAMLGAIAINATDVAETPYACYQANLYKYNGEQVSYYQGKKTTGFTEIATIQ